MPDLYHVRALCRDYPATEDHIAAVERVAAQRHATTLKCLKTGKTYGVVLFLCETAERARRLEADLLAHAPVVAVECPRTPVRYDSTPYLYPVGTRVRATEGVVNEEDENAVVIPAGSLGTIIAHENEHAMLVRFDELGELFAYDFELEEAGPPCIFCHRGAHYDLGFPDLFGVSCCCDHLDDAKAALGPEATCRDRKL